MIHVRAMKVPRGNKHGPLYGYYASSGFGPPNTKEQIRRGVLLATVASVLVLVGSMLTWLVYTEMFGSKVPIMGPLVMTLGIILVILATRQFCIVWKHKNKAGTTDKTNTAPAEEEDVPCESMLEMDTWDTGEGEKPAYLQHTQQVSYYDQLQGRPPGYLINSRIVSPCTLITTTTTTNITTLPHSIPESPPSSTGNMGQPSQPPVSPTTLTTPGGTTTSDSKVQSCTNLASMVRSGSVEAPNPRPVIRYSQGQLELLDRQAAAAAMGRTSPTLVASAPSHHSLGERSASPQERSSHKSLSLSIERTDILETI